MVFVPVTNTVEAALIYDNGGEEAINTLYFKYGAAINFSTLQSLAAALSGWVASYLMPCMSDNVAAKQIHLRDLTTATSLVWDFYFPSNTVGQDSGDIGAQSNTLSMSFKTGIAGRSYRGRNYMIGIALTHISDGVVETARANMYKSAYDQLPGAVAAAGFTWVIVSRYSGYNDDGSPKPRAAGIATNVSSWGFADLIVDSQRRRLPRRGR